MSHSGVRLRNVGSHCHQHLILGHRYFFNLPIRKFKYNLLSVSVDRNVLVSPSPFVGECNSLNGINVFQLSHECFVSGLEGIG